MANGMNLLAWQADVDHIMDNFSLRESMMKMLTDSETETRGLRLTLDQSPMPERLGHWCGCRDQ